LYIYNPQVGKGLANGHDYGMTIQGAKGWKVERVWAHRLGACFWCSGTDGTIRDCRATESWADGINLNNGPTVKADFAGLRLTADNNFIVGAADDGIAINAQNGGGIASNMVDTKVINNTSIGVMWANGMRIAGGRNTIMQNNLITDPTSSNGIRVGKFGTNGNPCESALVSDNLIIRGCGIRNVYGQAGISVADTATATIHSNHIIDSHRVGIDIHHCNAVFSANIIDNPGTQGFLIKASSIGSGTFSGNIVTNLKSGQVAFRNDASTTFAVSSRGNSWQPTGTEKPNDAAGSLEISLQNNMLHFSGIHNPTEVVIYNSSGQLVLRMKTAGVIDVSAFSKGIYLIAVANFKAQRFVK